MNYLCIAILITLMFCIDISNSYLIDIEMHHYDWFKTGDGSYEHDPTISNKSRVFITACRTDSLISMK